MNRLVLDASTAIAWCFEEPEFKGALALMEKATTIAFEVPAIWPLQVTNALLVAERKRRLDESRTNELIESLSRLMIAIDRAPGLEAAAAILVLARDHCLTIYDAAYLDLARRRGVPLATLDAELAKAARKINISLALS